VLLPNEQSARTNADSSLTNQINTLSATTAGNTAAIQSEATARSNGDQTLTTQIKQPGCTV